MYKYEEERANIFTEEGVKALLKIYTRIKNSPNGLITVWDAIKGTTVNSFLMLACVDYLKETYYVKVGDTGEMTQNHVIKYVGPQSSAPSAKMELKK